MKLLKTYKSLLLFVCLMVIFRSAIADWCDVPTGSMLPTIQQGDRILVDKMAYDLRIPLTHTAIAKLNDPSRGDIVVFDSETAGKRLVKRVIGLPGDVIELKASVLQINGKRVDYTVDGYPAISSGENHDTAYLTENLSGRGHPIQLSKWGGEKLDNYGPARVPPGHYVVFGDNRDNSADSRVFGYVPRSEIVGRSRMVVFSLDYERNLLPRTDRFFYQLP